MAATSSLKPKPKFSSRNVNALYKAPALRGGDASSVSAGYRTGGVNGLNRLLVLRGPARAGAQGVLDANTAAAPTPINTPSLRKEHMGQDIHVSLVPAGKGGGWGNGAMATAETAVNNAEGPRQRAGEQTAAASVATREQESVWSGSAPAAALVSRPRPPPPVRHVAAMFASASSGSGRWGDDAVEEDLAQVEIERGAERKREFPDLHAQDGAPLQQVAARPGDDDPSLASREIYTMSFQHQPQHSPLCDDHTNGSRQGAGYDHQGTIPGNNYVSAHCNGERGYHGQRTSFASFQDAQYDNPVRNDPHGRYDSYHEQSQQRLRRYSSHDESAAQDLGSQHSELFHHHELHRRDRSPTINSQSNRDSTRKPPDSAWKVPSNAAPAASNVWKMSEAEANAAVVPHMLKSNALPSSGSTRAVVKSFAVDSSRNIVSASTVRILQRNGPRMLFDHKSGIMVEVEDSKPSRRLNAVAPAQPIASMETKAVQADQGTHVIEIVKKERQPPPPTNETDRAEETREVDQLLPAHESTDTDVKTVIAVNEVKSGSTGPLSSRESRPLQVKSRTKEQKTKPLSMGGKMKRVVAANRPVVNPDVAAENAGKQDADTTLAPAPPLQGKDTRRQPIREGCKKSGSGSIDKETCGTTKPKPKSASIKTRAKPTMATASEKDCARPKQPKDSMRTKTDNRGSRSDMNGKSKRPPSKFGSVDSKLERATVEPEPVESLSVDDREAEEEMLDDGEGAFTTVKSRRTILLERKKQREQLAAALSGFHERGGVKQPNSRVTVPASTARFGKKGLVVGLKQKPKTASVAAPVLEKTFIDVIRPADTVSEAESSSHHVAVDAREEPVLQKSALHQSKKIRKLRVNSSPVQSKTENQQVKTEELVKETKAPIRQNIPVATCAATTGADVQALPTSKEKEDDGDRATNRPDRTQSVKTESHTRRTSAVTKKEIKMYVAKVTPVQTGTAVAKIPVAVGTPTTTALSPVAATVEVVSGHSRSVKKPATRKGSSTTKKPPSSSNQSRDSSETLSSVANEPVISTPSHETLSQNNTPSKPAPTKWKLSKKPKSDIPTNREESAPRHQNTSSTAKNESESQKANPAEPMAPPVTAPPAKMPRRPSNPKTAMTKSNVSTASSHKIYKKVYVVKSTVAAASPSAA